MTASTSSLPHLTSQQVQSYQQRSWVLAFNYYWLIHFTASRTILFTHRLPTLAVPMTALISLSLSAYTYLTSPHLRSFGRRHISMKLLTFFNTVRVPAGMCHALSSRTLHRSHTMSDTNNVHASASTQRIVTSMTSARQCIVFYSMPYARLSVVVLQITLSYVT